MTATMTETPTSDEFADREQDGAAQGTPEESLFRGLRALPAHDPARVALLDQLVTEHLRLAHHLARRFANRGEPVDDLLQVASIGLLKAIDRFDPDRGIPFVGYAIPTITGELKRHFRDSAWDVRVPRGLQELHLRIKAAVGELSHRDGRAPTATELATYLDIPRAEIIEGLQAGQAYTSTSLDLPTGPNADAPTLGATIGADDLGFEAVDNHETLLPLLAALPDRERRILHLRFVADMTQSQIAQEIGVSQMHISRLLSATLNRLRAGLLTDAG